MRPPKTIIWQVLKLIDVADVLTWLTRRGGDEEKNGKCAGCTK
jgi:hypothetical protein